jgi:mannitol-1-/sugar-/sorbitol-6-phosphatase
MREGSCSCGLGRSLGSPSGRTSSGPRVERAWTSWAAEHGVDPDVVLAIAHGSPPGPTIRRVLRDLDDRAVADAAARQMDLQYEDLSDVIAALGADRLLATPERLALPWVVVTSADVRLARARLGAAGVAEPPLLIGCDVSYTDALPALCETPVRAVGAILVSASRLVSPARVRPIVAVEVAR